MYYSQIFSSSFVTCIQKHLPETKEKKIIIRYYSSIRGYKEQGCIFELSIKNAFRGFLSHRGYNSFNNPPSNIKMGS